MSAETNKNLFALTPPMGWNSYDYYDTTVNEEDVKANAAVMAEKLAGSGWEYVVIDIEWHSHNPGSKRPRYQYIPFGEVEMDAYGRLLPCPKRFPSSAGGKGFAPLAEYVHGLGLKFGIHIMRGIPRGAAAGHLPVLGSSQTADEIADPSNICAWNPDMYGLRPEEPGSQAYYNSIFELYAQWGVDFVKCDDICRMDMASAYEEIRMLYEAISACGRAIVLSLSPGPAKIENAWWYEQHANMWRITDDLWDNWPSLHAMFERCEVWQKHVGDGCWPDCDMLPFGQLGKGFGNEWTCNLTVAEQETMMALWCIFRSPLMLGASLLSLKEELVELLTNTRLLAAHRYGSQPTQLERNADGAVWRSKDSRENAVFLALFNFREESCEREIIPSMWRGDDIDGTKDVTFENLITKEENTMSGDCGAFAVQIKAHGCVVLRVR